MRAVVFVGEPVGAGVALVFAPSRHEQAVGVAVLDGVGEVAQDVAQGGDGFGGEVVGERQAEVAGVHRPGPDGLGAEFVGLPIADGRDSGIAKPPGA